MKPLFLFLFAILSFNAYSQTIKFKMPSVTTAAGEDIIAFQVKDTNSYSGGGGGGGTSITTLSTLQFKKIAGPSTNELWKRSINQAVTPDVTFEFYDTNGVMYFMILIKDVQVVNFSYLSPECNGCSQLIHQVGMFYTKIETTDIATGVTVKYNLTTRTFY